jgi:hypothetical protein
MKGSARVKAEFEHSLLSCLLFNVLYMYYMDYRLVVLVIRIAQIFRLLYFPHEPPEMQRVTSALLVMSNLAVALIHGAIIAEGTAGEMLLINFIGPEPNALAKLFYVDFVIVLLQCALTSVSGALPGIVTTIPAALPRPDDAASVLSDEVADPASDLRDQDSGHSGISDDHSSDSLAGLDDAYYDVNPLVSQRAHQQTLIGGEASSNDSRIASSRNQVT